MLAPVLAAALTSVGRDWSAATRLPVTFELTPPDLEVPDEVASEILLIVGEALSDVAAHAQAQIVNITLSYQDGQLGVEVADDGRGFAAGHAEDRLASMRDRARAVGGELRVDSEPGNGTLIAVVVPLAAPDGSRRKYGVLIAGAAKYRVPGLIAVAVVAILAAVALFRQPGSEHPVLTEPAGGSTSIQPSETPPVSVEPPAPSAVVSKAAAAPERSTAKATCKVRYVKGSQWSSGFTAEVTITNLTSAQVTGWRLTWTFAGNQDITGQWNARLNQKGTAVTAEGANYNQRIKAGESVTFGFQASFSGSNPAPGSFTLNGNRCQLA